MDNEPLPDHYKALGLDKTCDTEAVKKAHRKLVLGCHPDKIKDTDPLKEQKLSQFHVVQKAYEVLTDPKERNQYEALLTLQALRKEKLARGGGAANTSSPREKSARFDVRTAGGSAAFQANTSSRFHTEERRPSRSFDDEDKYYDERERDRPRAHPRNKYDTYDAMPKGGSSPRSEKESSKAHKATTERTRAERTKTRDKEERRDRERTSKFVSVESDSSSADDKARHEAGYKRRSQEDAEQRRASEARRKDDRRSYDEPRYVAASSGRNKLSELEEQARLYQHKSRAQVDEAVRPGLVRASSRDYYDGSQRRSSRKEEAPRRSSAVRTSTKERASSSSKGYPEIVSWGEEETSSRRMPTMRTHNSSPANMEQMLPRAMPQRSYTTAETSTSRDMRASSSPHPSLARSQTMPVNQMPSSSRRPANVTRPSTLRETMTPEHSSPEREYSTIPPPKPSGGTTTYYRYPTADTSSHRTEIREPERQRKVSPEPLSRPPIGPYRPSEANISRSSRSPERGRSGKLYGEMSSSRPKAVRQSSYTTDNINYAPKYGPEDVRWAPKASTHTRENDRRFDVSGKPQMMRTATTAY